MSSIKIERHGGSSGMVQTMTTPSGDTLYGTVREVKVEGVGTPTWFTTEREALEHMESLASIRVNRYKAKGFSLYVKARKDAAARLEDIRDALAALPEEGEGGV